MESDRVNAISSEAAKAISPTLSPISGLSREERLEVLRMSLRRTTLEIERLEAQRVLLEREIGRLV